MTKSPLGRVCVPVDTEEKWKKLMQACEDHEYGFKWDGGERPTVINLWIRSSKNSVISFGWNKHFLKPGENIIGYDDVDYFKGYNAKFISFEEAMRRLGVKKWTPKIGEKLWTVSVTGQGVCVDYLECRLLVEGFEMPKYRFKTRKEAREKAKQIKEILTN